MGFLTGDTTGAEESLKRIFLKKSPKGEFKSYLQVIGKRINKFCKKAVDFEIEDIRGKKARLYKRHKKFILLYFWSIGCPPCIQKIPALNKLYDKFKNANIEFWAIGYYTQKFLEKNPFKFRLFKKYSPEIVKNYPIYVIPQVYIIDQENLIRYHSTNVDTKEIEEVIERLLWLY